jgi:hypothetical protein
MKQENYKEIRKIIRSILLKEATAPNDKITVLLPGGFKPPHGGHIQMIKDFASKSQVDKVIVMIGPKEREGFTRQDSLSVFNAISFPPNVEILPVTSDNPLGACYDFLFGLEPSDTSVFALGASTKDEDSATRSKLFSDSVEKYKTKPDKSGRTMPQGISATVIQAEPLFYAGRDDNNNGASISARILRNDIKEQNIKNVKTNYSNISEQEFKKILPVIMEKK